MKFSDLFATCGNGCAGSRPTGTRQRTHLLLEEVVDPVALRSVALGMVEDQHPRALERRHDDFVERGVLVVDQGMRRGRDIRPFRAGGDARARQA